MKECFVLTESSTFDELLVKLDDVGIGALPVVSPEGRFIGLVTDGDIRRGLIKKITNIKDIINTSPKVINADTPRSEIIRILRSMHRRQMPVVDANGNFVEMVILDEIEFNLRENKIVIMAGGLGTRLKELTKETPKPMLKVAGTPILEHIIREFKNNGFNHFVMCVNYKSHIIKDYFGDGKKHGIIIEYIEEKDRLGTAGALSLAKDLLTNPFFVMNGDILTTMNFSELMDFHLENHATGTICTTEYSHQIPYATVITDNKYNISQISEKPVEKYFINTGIYVLSPEAIHGLRENEYKDMPDLIKDLISEGKIIKSFNSKDYWIDIGQTADYQKANEEYLGRP